MKFIFKYLLAATACYGNEIEGDEVSGRAIDAVF